MTPLIAFAILSCAVFVGSPASADDAESLPAKEVVLERYLEALGGRENIENLTTRVCLGRMIHDLHWSRPPYEVVPVAGYAASPGRVLVVEHKSSGLRCEGFDGQTTWVQDADGIRTSAEPMRSKIAWLLDPNGALRLETYFPELEVTAIENLDGRDLYVLEPEGLDRAHFALYFDTETGLLVRIGYYWEIKDYRDAGGVLVPFRIDMSRKGGSSTLVLDSIEHNLPLEAVLFAVPEGTADTQE
jgi:hypothetical protein